MFIKWLNIDLTMFNRCFSCQMTEWCHMIYAKNDEKHQYVKQMNEKQP
jgi:hypothetical protein